jgi:hypothetical protein
MTIRKGEGDGVLEERAARIKALRAEIAEQAAVAAKLPDDHPVRLMYLDEITAKGAELRALENRQVTRVYLYALGLVTLGAVVAASGTATGILLGGFFVCTAIVLVVVHTLDA